MSPVKPKRKVLVVPEAVIHLSKPFTKASLAHNGRILRLGASRGPVLRSYYGTYR